MNFPCQGQWWLPGSQDKSVVGTLTFSRRDGAILSLADALYGADEPELEIIVGQTASGTYVTLLHAIRTAEPFFRLMPTMFPCSYHAPLLITGAAFNSKADMRFSLWQIRFPELNTWAGKDGFEIQPVFPGQVMFDGLDDCPEVQINYRIPPKQVLLSQLL